MYCFSIANIFSLTSPMDSSPLFCSGLELGKLVVSSGLLRLSWSKISELHGSIDRNQDSDLRFHIYQEAKYTIVAFVAPPLCTRRYLFRDDGTVNSTLTLLDDSSDSNLLHSLFKWKTSFFSIHIPAFELFNSVYNCLCSQLFISEKPLIVTGFELGGSVASLFTLWLLDRIECERKRPLCITFGSTLIGDASLQQILENSIWNSYFLHVASTQDLFPKLLIPSDYSPLVDDSKAATFKPFGTFLVCYESGCVCIEDPDAVLELLAGINGGLALDDRMNICQKILQGLERPPIYGGILHDLERSLVLMNGDLPSESISDWLLIGMFLQPDHSGMEISQDMRVICDVITHMKERRKKNLRFDRFKQLIEMKINMAQLEWYKKTVADMEIGYYDHFKYKSSKDVEYYKKRLTDYWIDLVEEERRKPQMRRPKLRRRFLYAGNNYRRMVEPLDIAEHYNKEDPPDYKKTRSQHYILLEKLLEEAGKPKNRPWNSNMSNLLTIDSCFWAEVEEAMKSIGLLKKSGIIDAEMESLAQKLDGFEENVWKMIQDKTVSPEIFLKRSSFMKWWREYKEFKGDGYKSAFTNFMNQRGYQNYGTKPMKTYFQVR